MPGERLEEPGTSGGGLVLCATRPSEQLAAGVRWWAALPGLPLTQGLPGLLGTKVIAGSDATVPIGEKKAIPHSSEPPLLFLDRETHADDFSSCLARCGALSPRLVVGEGESDVGSA